MTSAPLSFVLFGKALRMGLLRGPIRARFRGARLRLDGKPAATQTYRRRRAVVFNSIQFAVELEALPSNSLSRVRRKRGKRPVQEVDRRVVVDPRQARELLAAVTYVGGYERASGRRLRAFFGCPYYAAMRPGEALGLRRPERSGAFGRVGGVPESCAEGAENQQLTCRKTPQDHYVTST